MVQTATTLFITIGSAALFVYWFRYTSLLILSAKTTRDFAGEIAEAHNLQFQRVQTELRSASGNLDALQAALDTDYQRIQTLLTNSGGESRLEDRMLAINYRFTGAWFKLVKTVAPDTAMRSLNEMSMIVAHFANTLGERNAQASAA